MSNPLSQRESASSSMADGTSLRTSLPNYFPVTRRFWRRDGGIRLQAQAKSERMRLWHATSSPSTYRTADGLTFAAAGRPTRSPFSFIMIPQAPRRGCAFSRSQRIGMVFDSSPCRDQATGIQLHIPGAESSTSSVTHGRSSITSVSNDAWWSASREELPMHWRAGRDSPDARVWRSSVGSDQLT